RSPTPTPTPTPTPSPTDKACTATYKVINEYPGGFQGEVTVQNSGTSTINGWTVQWNFPNGQTISQLWNGTVSSSGAGVTVTNLSYNGTLAPDASTTFGLNGKNGRASCREREWRCAQRVAGE